MDDGFSVDFRRVRNHEPIDLISLEHAVDFPDFSNPTAVANGVLECLKSRNLHRLTGFFNDANRNILHFGKNRKFLVHLSRILEFAARKFSNVEDVAEIREMAKDDSWDFQALAGKLHQENDQMHLIALTREGNQYFFDQISVSHILEYEKWKLLSVPFINENQPLISTVAENLATA